MSDSPTLADRVRDVVEVVGAALDDDIAAAHRTALRALVEMWHRQSCDCLIMSDEQYRRGDDPEPDSLCRAERAVALAVIDGEGR